MADNLFYRHAAATAAAAVVACIDNTKTAWLVYPQANMISLLFHSVKIMSLQIMPRNRQSSGSVLLFLVIKFKTWAKAQSRVAVPVSSSSLSLSLSSVELDSSESEWVNILITEQTDNFIGKLLVRTRFLHAMSNYTRMKENWCTWIMPTWHSPSGLSTAKKKFSGQKFSTNFRTNFKTHDKS